MQTIEANRTRDRWELRVRCLRQCSAWSPAEDQALRVAFRRGSSIDELAVMHGRAVHAVRSRLLALGETTFAAAT